MLYASTTPLTSIERHLTQHMLGDGVAGAVRATAARTRDLLPAVARVFEFLHPDVAMGNTTERTMVRLELGLPPELVELGSLLGGSLTRAQYLAAFEQGISTPEQFEAAGPEDLSVDLNLTLPRLRSLQKQIRERRRHQQSDLGPLLPAPTE
jgi:hypothetical protein